MSGVKRFVFAILLLPVAGLGGAQEQKAQRAEPSLWLSFAPAATIPLGADAEIFGVGGGLQVTAQYGLGSLPLFLLGGLSYELQPAGGVSLSTLALSAGGGARWPLGEKLFAGAYLQGGYYLSFLNSSLSAYPDDPSMGSNPLLAGGLFLGYRLLPSWSLALEASYRNWVGLEQGIGAGLQAIWHLRGAGLPAPTPSSPKPKAKQRPTPLQGDPLELTEISLETLFPVFYKFYDEHPAGKAVLLNRGGVPASRIRVSLFVKQYMDNPKQAAAPAELAPGEKAEVSFYALLTDQVLAISEGTKVSAQILLEYEAGGQARRREYVETLRLQDRNAVIWDDDRKAAAFVTAKEPEVLRLSRVIASSLRGLPGVDAFPSLASALATHETLRLMGLKYVVDPTTPYKELSQNRLAVDFLQFPRQTLEFRTGDCDDLSVLYAALLESVGRATALITIPGHIYAAVNLELAPEAAQRQFLQPGELIFQGGQTWLPVEVTALDEGFLKAWQRGARQWREFEAKGQARLYPVQEAWRQYEPVGYTQPGAALALPAQEQVRAAAGAEILRFADRELAPRVAKLEGEIRQGGGPRAMNSLGVLYARFGLDEKAEGEFRRALARGEFVPSLINLGKLSFLSGKLQEAQGLYERAAKADPANATALLGLAIVQHRLENYGTARRLYARLREMQPEMAQRYAFLDMQGQQAARASEAAAQEKGALPWQE